MCIISFLAICIYRYTQYYSDDKPVYLDRHTLSCQNGYVMNAVKLQQNSLHNKIRYRYRCCSTRFPCTDSRTINQRSYNGGGEGNTVNLDHQTINCYDKALSYLKLDTFQNYWNYKYDCCKTDSKSATVSCYNANTAFDSDGDGKSMFLDRHEIACKANYFITKFNLVRNSNNQYRYDYRCCKVNKPVDGGYGQWSSYGDCSKSCGGGTQMRTRKCDSPAPAFGGKDCFGPNQNFRLCNKQKCPSEYNHSIPLC